MAHLTSVDLSIQHHADVRQKVKQESFIVDEKRRERRKNSDGLRQKKFYFSFRQ
jgi:hypothetical protein